jgi:hypothetical protein
MRDSGYDVQTTHRSSEWTSKRTRRPNKRDRADSKEHDDRFLRLSRFGALSSFPEGQTANEEFYPTTFRRLLAAVLYETTDGTLEAAHLVCLPRHRYCAYGAICP